MISAWDVYWVMQLDSIRFGVILFSAILCAVSGVLFFIAAEEGSKKQAKTFGVSAISGAFLLFSAAFIPETKTAAAMIILPAVTSEEAVNIVKPEAKELYELTKDALRSVITEKTTKEIEK